MMKYKALFLLFVVQFFAVTSFSKGLDEAVRRYLAGKPREIGVAVIIQDRDTLAWNNDSPYPLMSVCKLFQALSVADYLCENRLSIQTPVTIGEEDLQPDTYSPLRDRYPRGGVTLTVADLLRYSLQLSDNNACDILFRMTGGPQQTDRYLRELGLEDFRIAVDEAEMHRDLASCYENWSTPLETACLVNRLFTTAFLPDTLQQFICRTLLDCRTGEDRLPRPLAKTGARIGHKTGTGDRNAEGELIGVNDAGFVILPDGRHYTVVVFVKDIPGSLERASQIIADISDIVYRRIR